jgi:hypothetical protein
MGSVVTGIVNPKTNYTNIKHMKHEHALPKHTHSLIYLLVHSNPLFLSHTSSLYSFLKIKSNDANIVRYSFLTLYRATKDKKWLHRAIQFGLAYANPQYNQRMRTPDR